MSVSKMIDDIEMQIKILYVDSESRKLLLGMTSDIKPHVQKLEKENDELREMLKKCANNMFSGSYKLKNKVQENAYDLLKGGNI